MSFSTFQITETSKVFNIGHAVVLFLFPSSSEIGLTKRADLTDLTNKLITNACQQVLIDVTTEFKVI